MKDWYPDELATVGSGHLDPSFVAAYDEKSAYDPADDVASLLSYGVGAADTVVDIGAATGVFSLAIAGSVAQVVAVEPSPAMVAVLRRRTHDIANIRVAQDSFLTWSADRSSVAAVFTRNALHHLPDFWKVRAIQRIADALQPEGLLMLRDLVFDHDPGHTDEAVAGWLRSAGTDPHLGYTAPELAEHLRTEFSTFTWLLEPMLERCGFAIVERETNRGVYSAFTCRKKSP